MAFTLLFTEAGRAALINAAQTGTEKRTVVSAGVTDTPFTSSADITELPGEIKRIEAVSGAAIAPDQISLAILDTGTDTYKVTGLGLYLDDGTLLAVFSQEAPFIVKTEFSFAHFQADVMIKDASIKPEDIQFGALEFLVPPATETIEGVARIATQDDVDAKTDDSTIITPKKLGEFIAKNVVIATPEEIAAGTEKKLVDAHGMAFYSRTPGEIGTFCFEAPPTGWLLANGEAVSRTTYARLFAAIGETFGAGDGSTTFNLPDLRGEFIRGADLGRGVDADRALGSAQGDAIQNITGSLTTLGQPGGADTGDGAFSVTKQAAEGRNTSTGTGIISTFNFNAADVVKTSNETRPRNIAIAYFIYAGT